MNKIFLMVILFLGLARSLTPASLDPLEVWYHGYNVSLFDSELPDKIAIDHDLHDDRFMAITDYDFNGKFYRISFNSKYGPSPKQERETLIHEQCHIRNFIEGEEEIDQHGPKWQSCMHEIANKNGFENLW